jgi:hypothetical protein
VKQRVETGESKGQTEGRWREWERQRRRHRAKKKLKKFSDSGKEKVCKIDGERRGEKGEDRRKVQPERHRGRKSENGTDKG